MQTVDEIRAFLVAQLEQLRIERDQLGAQINANGGAMQICEGLIAKIDQANPHAQQEIVIK